MVKQKTNLVQMAYGNDVDFKKGRDIVETAFGITIKSKNDIQRASTLSVLSSKLSDKDAIRVGASVGAVTKSTAKKLGVADLF